MKKILTVLSIASLSYLSAATLTTDKPVYKTTDTIKINFSEMDNHNKDWIAIYPKGSSTAWKNVVKWAWTENKSEGTLTFKNLPAGEYEVKGFYNNSYEAEAAKEFKVEGDAANIVQEQAGKKVVQAEVPNIDDLLFLPITYSSTPTGDIEVTLDNCEETYDIINQNNAKKVKGNCK